jgi:hypothetical protein
MGNGFQKKSSNASKTQVKPVAMELFNSYASFPS